MSSKAFNKTVIMISAILLILTALFMIVTDPYFHYHGKLKGLEYPMQNEFYQNAGIARNFEYEIMVAGDSETQNISTSVIEKLWGMKTVKLPNPGAPFVETDMVVRSALKNNPDIKMVIRPLDDYMLNADPYLMRYKKQDLYLYDSNPFNDVRYIFEKETIADALSVLTYTRSGKTTINFDLYSRTDLYETYGNYDFLKLLFDEKKTFGFEGSEEEIYDNARVNVQENIIETAKQYPDVDFLFFITPYSACYWKKISDNNLLDVALGVERVALEEMLEIDNIQIFSFMDCYEITTDWSNYSDEIHFKGAVDDYMFEKIYAGEHLITKDNYDSYLQGLKAFYEEYDYNEMLNPTN